MLGLDVGEGVRTARVGHEQGVALGEVPGVSGAGAHLDEAAVAVLAAAGRDALRDDGRIRVGSKVDHLGAGVRLLGVVGHGHGVKFADAAVAFEDAARVLPGDGGAGLDLRPADLGAGLTDAALGHEVEDASLAFCVAWVPILDGAVLDFGVVLGDELDARGVKLVLVALGGGTAL